MSPSLDNLKVVLIAVIRFVQHIKENITGNSPLCPLVFGIGFVTSQHSSFSINYGHEMAQMSF